MTSNTAKPADDLPAYFKWIMFGFILVFILCIVAWIVLSEYRYPTVSISHANHLIKDCKVARVYEIGSPSARRPNRVRTMLELKNGEIIQTEFGTHMANFKRAMNSADCHIVEGRD